jgi:hypothetical protein
MLIPKKDNEVWLKDPGGSCVMKFFGILPLSGQDDGNCNCNDNSRFPLGMTTRKVRAKARTTATADSLRE